MNYLFPVVTPACLHSFAKVNSRDETTKNQDNLAGWVGLSQCAEKQLGIFSHSVAVLSLYTGIGVTIGASLAIVKSNNRIEKIRKVSGVLVTGLALITSGVVNLTPAYEICCLNKF